MFNHPKCKNCTMDPEDCMNCEFFEIEDAEMEEEKIFDELEDEEEMEEEIFVWESEN